MKLTAQSLTVWIDVDAWRAIECWIRLAGTYEVSGLGLIEEERDERGGLLGYHVTDVFLPEQVNGHTSTELAPESVAKLMIEVEERFGASDNLRFWWHFHPGNIGLIWSHTDDECIEDLRNGAWYVSTVFDPQMECRTRVDLYDPVRITIDQVTTKLRFNDSDLEGECADLYKARVKRRQVISDKRGDRGLLGFPSVSRAPGPNRYVSAEELLLAKEALETGGMSYAEYLALVDGDELLLDDGWFGFDGQPEPAAEPRDDNDNDNNGKEAKP